MASADMEVNPSQKSFRLTSGMATSVSQLIPKFPSGLRGGPSLVSMEPSKDHSRLLGVFKCVD